jgi:hypothetical protein
LRFWRSDHRPLLLLTAGFRDRRRSRRPRRFFFEESWIGEPECDERIRRAWGTGQSGDQSPSIADALGRCRQSLSRWGGESNREIRDRIEKQKKIVELAGRSGPDFCMESFRREERQLDALIQNEEQYWRQRSRVSWMRCGDKNTKLFHRKASARRKRNAIRGLEDDHGDWQSGDTEIGRIVSGYFGDIFSSARPSSQRIELVSAGVQPRISEALNAELERPFEPGEVKMALFSMDAIKAPGSDGFPAIFYQRYWDVVGESVLKTCPGVLNDGDEVATINDTVVTLIPKVEDPRRVSDFRPISLCNVIYKIVVKCLVNRIKTTMHDVISESQSAFVGGRLIFDNVMAGFEVLHTMKRKRFGNGKYASLKLDMAKAFDRVEWAYLESMMRRLGYSTRWVHLIMRCVTSVRFTFNINGSIRGSVTPFRGLRQGDPLSPFIFLFCSEGLSSLFRASEDSGAISGVRFRDFHVSHLLFADDSLVFCRATPDECDRVTDILRTYSEASGQMVNFQKSDVCFGTEVSDEEGEVLAQILGVKKTDCHKRYLGLPAFTGRRKAELFGFVRDRVWAKIKSWNGLSLSQAGR